jgi:hypothetical protein
MKRRPLVTSTLGHEVYAVVAAHISSAIAGLLEAMGAEPALESNFGSPTSLNTLAALTAGRVVRHLSSG